MKEILSKRLKENFQNNKIYQRFISIFTNYWMYLFLIFVAILTIGGMISYQYMRRDPVVITMKDAKGYKTTQIVHKTPNETVAQVIEKTGTSTDDYSCSRDLNQRIHTATHISLAEPISGTITVDENVINYTTSVQTVEEVLRENGVEVTPVDIVTPELTATLTKGNSNIVIQRVASSSEVKTEVIPYPQETVPNDQKTYNATDVLQKGQNGFRSYTEVIVYSQGSEVERHITGEQRVEPVPEIVEVGTNLTVGKPLVEPGDIEGWRPYVIKALEENGLEPTEDRVSRVLRQIVTESDGDQNIHQQIVDVNTFIGEEARGLLQTTPSTFREYHHPGYDDILNGYHNLLAAINYAKEEYGPDLVGMGRGIGY